MINDHSFIRVLFFLSSSKFKSDWSGEYKRNLASEDPMIQKRIYIPGMVDL